jgi:hypothetical protein
MARPVRMAECHPDRRRHGNGLCSACYQTAKRRRLGKPERAKTWAICHPDRRNYGRGLCQQCWRAERRRDNPRTAEAFAQWYARRGHARHIQRTYGLTQEQYDDMLRAQGGGCAICSNHPRRRALHVDHCHTTGVVRGLLCAHCNWAVGKAEKNSVYLPQLLEYVRNAQEKYSG